MSKIIINVGNYDDDLKWVVLGDFRQTDKKASASGYTLRAFHGEYFTNNEHVINGVRRAIKDGIINHEDVEIRFRETMADDIQKVYFNQKAEWINLPNEMFAQLNDDLGYILFNG